VEEERMPPILRVDEALGARRAADIARWRAARDARACATALEALAAAARDEARNLMPPILAAADADATVGEICGALESVFGRYRPVAAL
jgi:methylmalonyl-CoA mutase N-terminal domain/subunit